MATKKSKSLSTSQKVGIGVGLTAAAAAAAGAYFLYGSPNATKNRTQVKSWMLKAKAEVLEKLEYAKEMTQAEYETLIDEIAKTYSSLKVASKTDIVDFKKEMKAHWNKISKHAPVKKSTAAAAKKTTKKAAKKVTKKTGTKKVTKKSAKKTAAK